MSIAPAKDPVVSSATVPAEVLIKEARRRGRQQLALLITIVALLAGGLTWLELGRGGSAQPPVDVAAFVPKHWHVLSELQIRVAHQPLPDVAVAVVGPPINGRFRFEGQKRLRWESYTNVFVLAYDASSGTWRRAFDAAKYGNTARSIGWYGGSLMTCCNGAAIVTYGFNDGPHIYRLFDRPGANAELALFVSSAMGNTGNAIVGIVGLHGDAATLKYKLTMDFGHPGGAEVGKLPASGSKASVVGAVGHQELRVSLPLVTAYTSESEAARTYDVLIGRTAPRRRLGIVFDDDALLGVACGYSEVVCDVKSVLPGSAAAGRLRAGDSIVKIDGHRLKFGGWGAANAAGLNLLNHVSLLQPGSAVRLEVLRGGRTRTFIIRLGQSRPSTCSEKWAGYFYCV
jgi:hypothetical protein